MEIEKLAKERLAKAKKHLSRLTPGTEDYENLQASIKAVETMLFEIQRIKAFLPKMEERLQTAAIGLTTLCQ